MYVCILLILAVAAWIDLRRRKIPNELCLCVAEIGLIYWHGWYWAGAGVLIASAITLILFKLKQLGGGDVKLFIALGLCLGPIISPLIILLSLLLAGVISPAYLLRGKNSLPLAPCILGASIMLGVVTC